MEILIVEDTVVINENLMSGTAKDRSRDGNLWIDLRMGFFVYIYVGMGIFG